jgi:DNA polymerase-4
VQALWGVGPATLAKLERLGVATVGDLAAMPLTIVVGALGSSAGNHLHQLATGLDERRVEPDRQAKSIGHEETFVEDRRERAELERELVRFADAIGSRLRGAGLAGRTVSIKVRFGDFRTITRASTLADPTDSHQAILREARQLLAGVDPGQGVRLLGVSVSGLTADPVRQLSLTDVDGPDWTEANRAIDEIRERFGATAIGPAVVTGVDGLRLKTRGNQQWGPDERPAPDDGPTRRR